MFARYVVGGRLDPPYYPTLTEPHYVGRQVEITSFPSKGVERIVRDTFTMSHDLEFYGISISSVMDLEEDYWTLSVNGKVIVKKSYTMQYSEGLLFSVAHPVAAGQEFIFEYHSKAGDKNQVSVMYHFLTKPDTDLIVTGATETEDVPTPEPPPETPTEIQLPVSWSTFISVATAEQWAENLGVSVDFDNNINAANYVTEALAYLLNNCGGFSTMITKNKLTINIKDGGGANGYFNPPTGEVVVSKTYNFENAANIAAAEYAAHQKSSPNRLRTVIHEIGHWLHFHNVGAQRFYEISALDPDNYGAASILTQADSTYIANNLCNYATKWFPIELMPETFTAMVTGIPVQPKIMEWYRQYGGYECSSLGGGS